MDATTRPRLAEEYGLAVDADGNLPALEALGDGPITLVNLFALRAVAAYPDGETCSGVEAMLRYGAVSGDRLAAVGGRFVAQALPTGVVWGDASDGDWDLVVVATYPDVDAFWSLLADDEYRAAFAHRRAAVARQRVTVGVTM
jgi:uncharacterized protein (DUF1330 family)